MTEMTPAEILSALSDTQYVTEWLEENGFGQIGEGYSRTVWASGNIVIKINATADQNWSEYETWNEASAIARAHLAECLDISDCGKYLIMRRLFGGGKSGEIVSALPVLNAEGLDFEELGCMIVDGVEIAFDYAERLSA